MLYTYNHTYNPTTIKTPFFCHKCGYKHSDQVIEVTSQNSTTWQVPGEIYCGYCGGTIEHITLTP